MAVKTLLRVSLELVEDDFGGLTVRIAEKSHRGELHGEAAVSKEMLLTARVDSVEYCLENLRRELMLAREGKQPVETAEVALRVGRVPRDWMESTEGWEPRRYPKLEAEAERILGHITGREDLR